MRVLHRPPLSPASRALRLALAGRSWNSHPPPSWRESGGDSPSWPTSPLLPSTMPARNGLPTPTPPIDAAAAAYGWDAVIADEDALRALLALDTAGGGE